MTISGTEIPTIAEGTPKIFRVPLCLVAQNEVREYFFLS